MFRVKKSIIIVLLISLASVIISCSPFKKGFEFDGTVFNHTKKMSGGEITNHFYTPNGDDFSTATRFIQIIEVSDKIPKDDWPDRFTLLYNQYNLKPMGDNDFELSGSFQKSGLFLNSYAALVNVDGREYMAFYINSTGKEQVEKSESEKIDILYELQIIKFN